ncbi:cytochrome c3 [Shewanella amazonensis SB2B]|uniref:Cytochrome c3 n=1 Tax=Shewanella amazonensis (strain ATCC BAA-1098 / SB2B) TaxID=326297 RepID=A1S5J5_SHEAM|nr:cytochrome c3 family protein [Shewanella litorisediminis]ABL99651.1 cytochrome c3 [Shewanella amazonensis SB2B]
MEDTIVSKTLLSAIFGAAFAALALTPAAFAGDQTLAEFHVENGGCDSCHKDESPSADGAYEFEQCQSCHGTLAEMDDVHKPHDGNLVCADCHAPHDNNVGQKPTCESCHDDGRTADSVLKK